MAIRPAQKKRLVAAGDWRNERGSLELERGAKANLIVMETKCIE